MTPETEPDLDTELEFDGMKQPISEWALDYGITPRVIIGRLKRGLSAEAAITTPMQARRGDKLPARPSVALLAKQHGITEGTLRHRISCGMTIEEALSAGKRRRQSDLAALAAQHGLPVSAVRSRMQRGMTREQALTTPLQIRSKRSA